MLDRTQRVKARSECNTGMIGLGAGRDNTRAKLYVSQDPPRVIISMLHEHIRCFKWFVVHYPDDVYV